MIKLAPSVLSADFSTLSDQVRQVEEAGAEYLHLDVMDGHFVPNITFGPGLVKDLRPHTQLFFDVHLMIENPDLFVEEFVIAGADLVSVHVEACCHLHRTVQNIKALGVKAAVALNPATPLTSIEEILPELDMVLLMSVNPGFGGQQFIPLVLDKIKRLKTMIRERDMEIDIQVDGGVSPETVESIVEAGANILVAGSSIFKKEDIGQAVRDLKTLADEKAMKIWKDVTSSQSI